MKTNPALSALRHHVSGAIARGEAQAITEVPAPTRPEHTPGPWEVGGKVGLYCDDVQITSNKEPVAIAVPRRSYDIMSLARRSPAELSANARLIAAAPELLAALESIAAIVPDVMSKQAEDGFRYHTAEDAYRVHLAGLINQARNQARAAIAKATGGAA